MPVTIITTTYADGKAREEKRTAQFVADAEGAENELINLHPQMRYQRFRGFGGALTESSGYVLQQMGGAVTEAVLRDYFGEGGLHYTCARMHIDSCDFSLGNYSAVTDPDDAELASFSLERDHKYVIPLALGAQRVGGRKLSVLLSPWSPPAFMKSNGRKNNGGTLKPEYRGRWAKYICRYIAEYRKLGIGVDMVTMQNEPKATQTWDSCVVTAEEEREFIRNFLAPELARQGLTGVDILAWDHNKERVLERAEEVFSDGEMERLVAGVGVHWYSGDHFEALSMIRERFPGKRVVATEGCVEYSRAAGRSQVSKAQQYAHDIIGDLNAGVDTYIDWNIVLDERGGPNHVGNFCEAPVLCDTRAGTYEKMLSFHYIGHFSRYILPGAVRVGLSRYSDALEATAFQNEDGSFCVVVLNRSQEAVPFTLRQAGQICALSAPPESILTALY